MKIHTALRKLTELRKKYVRLEDRQKINFSVVIPVKYSTVEEAIEEELKKGKELEIKTFYQYEEELKKVWDEMTNLRESIDYTCHNTKIDIDGKSISLARLRMMVEELNKTILRLNNIEHSDRRMREYYSRESLVTVNSVEKLVKQVNSWDLDNFLYGKVQEKNKLDGLLTKINVETELLV